MQNNLSTLEPFADIQDRWVDTLANLGDAKDRRTGFPVCPTSSTACGVFCDVDWTALPAATPTQVVTLLRRCLQKDPQKRLPHIGVARFDLDEASSSQTQAPPVPASQAWPLWRRALLIGGAAIVAASLAVLVKSAWRPTMPPPTVRFTIALPSGQDFSNPVREAIAISPDGTQIVYESNRRLYRRGLSDAEAAPIPGTEVAPNALSNPAFSPDGRSIAFFVGQTRTIKRVGLEGGGAVTVCSIDAAVVPYGLTWDDSGLLFAHPSRGIMRVSPNGGAPELLAPSGPGELMHAPVVIPGTRTLLFASTSGADV